MSSKKYYSGIFIVCTVGAQLLVILSTGNKMLCVF